MRIDKHEIKHKQHLANQRRVVEIEKMLKDKPLIKLDKPIVAGWSVTYELRGDIKKRDDAFDLQQVLDIGYAYSVIRNVKHVKMIRQGIKGYETVSRGERYWHSFYPGRMDLKRETYESLPPQIKKYFYLDTAHERYWKYGREYFYGYLPEHYTVLRCRPIIHTHYQSKGGKLEKERDFLKHQISEYWKLSEGSNYFSSYPAHKDRTRIRDKIQKFKKGEIEDIENEKIPKEYDY